MQLTDTIRTVLVVGATGKTGRRLTPKLRERGITVREASRKPGPGRTAFSWQDRATHAAALAGVDAVYVIPPELVENPTELTAPVLEAAARARVQRIVLVSSLGLAVPGEPAASGRLALERQITSSGLAWTLLRPSGFMQNFSEGFLAPGVQQGALASATGDGVTAFIDADDIAAAGCAALTEPGHAGATYALTGPAALSFAHAAETIGAVLGRTITHRPITSAEMTAMLVGFGLPADYVAVLIRDQESIRSGAGGRVTEDVQRVTGRPPTSFARFAERAWSMK
ncbi:MAG: NAD(P)H-binding protein [Kofleriaceae bacterium]